MGFTKSLLAVAALAASGSSTAQVQPSAQLLDLAARIHYGYYHGEPRTIDAATAALERLGESPAVSYYLDFAALRRAQLGDHDRAVSARLSGCAQREVPAGDKARETEGWVLAAACALVAGDSRGSAAALGRARALDADHPRIGLVESWALERAAGDDATRREALIVKLTRVVEAFAAWPPSIDDPDWGYAESLTTLAANVLERGQVRAARDLIERALLLAPGYRRAVELRLALQSARTENRAL